MPNISEGGTICSLQPNQELVGMFFTVQEISYALRVSVDTVYRLIDKRELPCHMIAGCKRISQGDLLSYLGRNRQQAKHEDDYGHSED